VGKQDGRWEVDPLFGGSDGDRGSGLAALLFPAEKSSET